MFLSSRTVKFKNSLSVLFVTDNKISARQHFPSRQSDTLMGIDICKGLHHPSVVYIPVKFSALKEASYLIFWDSL